MKSAIIVYLAFGLALTGFARAATDQPRHLEPSTPRTVSVSESEVPPVIRTGLLQATLIVLPPEEKVANVFAGDTVDWVFDGGHIASRFVSIKPRVANSATDIHIVSDHGNTYTLELREISSEPDPHFDSTVTIMSEDKQAKERLVELPVFVPASELDKARQEAANAKAAVAAELKAEDSRAEQYRSHYPETLHFDYMWDQRKGKLLGLEQIWRDDKFTYLRGHFQEPPVLYEEKEKKGSLVNFDFADGLYTVPKKLDNGYLEIGKQKVEFHRVEGKD